MFLFEVVEVVVEQSVWQTQMEQEARPQVVVVVERGTLMNRGAAQQRHHQQLEHFGAIGVVEDEVLVQVLLFPL